MRRTRTPRPWSSSSVTCGRCPPASRRNHGTEASGTWVGADAVATGVLEASVDAVLSPSGASSGLSVAGGGGTSHGSYFFRSSSERTRRYTGVPCPVAYPYL